VAAGFGSIATGAMAGRSAVSSIDDFYHERSMQADRAASMAGYAGRSQRLPASATPWMDRLQDTSEDRWTDAGQDGPDADL
jgi:hypothetical protein